MPLPRFVLVLCLCLLPTCRASAQVSAAPTAAPPLADLSRSLQELSAKVSPTVVQIFVTGYAAPDDDKEQTYSSDERGLAFCDDDGQLDTDLIRKVFERDTELDAAEQAFWLIHIYKPGFGTVN